MAVSRSPLTLGLGLLSVLDVNVSSLSQPDLVIQGQRYVDCLSMAATDVQYFLNEAQPADRPAPSVVDVKNNSYADRFTMTR